MEPSPSSYDPVSETPVAWHNAGDEPRPYAPSSAFSAQKERSPRKKIT
jgi:hypothetical protein